MRKTSTSTRLLSLLLSLMMVLSLFSATGAVTAYAADQILIRSQDELKKSALMRTIRCQGNTSLLQIFPWMR